MWKSLVIYYEVLVSPRRWEVVARKENGLQHGVLLDRRRGCCVRGEVATGGRAQSERTDRPRDYRPPHRSGLRAILRVSGSGGRVKEKSYDIANKLEAHRRTGGGTEQRKKLSTCCLRTLTQRPCSMPTLVPYFGLDRPTVRSFPSSSRYVGVLNLTI